MEIDSGRILESLGIDRQNLLPSIANTVKHLFRRKETDNDDYNLMKAILKKFYREGEFPVKEIMEMVFNVVMRMEREQFLGAEHYERTGENRRGDANGYKPKRLATQVGMLDVQVPKTANQGDAPFYPSTLARGQRSNQAVLNAVAECYF